jgi:hypothetical protein
MTTRYGIFSHALLKVAVAALITLPAGAQTGASTGMTGSVTDHPDGLPIPDVTTTVVWIETGQQRTVSTNLQGQWEIRFLSPGPYQVRFERPGFRAAVRQPVLVSAREMTRLDVQLRPGKGGETAQAESPSSPTPASAGGAPGHKELEALPSSSRNFTQIAVIKPGVSTDISELVSNDNASVAANVDGSRTSNNSFVFNGIDLGSPGSSEESEERGSLAPAPETLAEVKLQTGLYDAATGRSGGGNFQLVSKSGTNEFHGTVYHFFQNEKLIANDFFFNRAGSERPMLRRNEGGFAIGGPIIKNKTFFFGSYQATRAKTAFVNDASNTIRMPRDLTDDRSDEAINRFARALGVQNIAEINPTSRALLEAQFADGSYLIPSGANGFNCQNDGIAESCQVLRIVPATFRQDQFTINIDHFYTDQPSRDPLASHSALSLLEELSESGQRVLSVADVHVFRPTLVNEFRAGYFHSRNDVVAVPHFTNAEFGINNPVADVVPDLARIDIQPRDVGENFRFGTLDESSFETQKTFTFADTVSLTKGKHSIRIGGEVRRSHLDSNSRKTLNLSYELRSWFDFLTVGRLDSKGRARQFREVESNYRESARSFRMGDYNFFLADDWRVTQSLTLNIGFRYEYDGFPSEVDGQVVNYDHAAALVTGKIEDGFVFASNFDEATISGASEIRVRKAGNRTALRRDWNNFAPRFGLAWSPPALKNVVLRGGYGIFYERPGGTLARSQRRAFPFLREQEIREVGDWNSLPQDRPVFPIPDLLVGFRGGQPQLESADDPGAPFAPYEVQAVDPGFVVPYTQHWSLAVQWEFRKDYLLEIGYVGTKGTKLLQTANVNQALDIDEVAFLARPGLTGGGFTTNFFDIVDGRFVPATTPPCDVFEDPQDCTIPAELRGPLLGFAPEDGISTSFSNANSIYNGLQLSLAKRHSQDHTWNVNYTFSKSIDTFSGERASQIQHDQRRPFLNRALSDFDQKHRLTASWTWELPWAGSRWTEGWSVSGILTLQSGEPFTIVDDEYSGFLFSSRSPRPSIIAGVTHSDLVIPGLVTSRVDRYLNPEALVHSGPQFGTLGRNTVRGPDQRRVDLVASKQTKITDRLSLEFRAEFFNAFNTVTFRPPEDDLSRAGFGQITRTRGGPRVIQFGLKLRF